MNEKVDLESHEQQTRELEEQDKKEQEPITKNACETTMLY